MKFFQPTLLPEPLGQILRMARLRRGLSKRAAARGSLLYISEIEALESDRPIPHRLARLRVVNYARFLGMNLQEIRESLPPTPGFSTQGQEYLSLMAEDSPRVDWMSPFRVLAPLGRIAFYIFIAVMLLGALGMVRQISRIRPMPWITASNRISTVPAQ